MDAVAVVLLVGNVDGVTATEEDGVTEPLADTDVDGVLGGEGMGDSDGVTDSLDDTEGDGVGDVDTCAAAPASSDSTAAAASATRGRYLSFMVVTTRGRWGAATRESVEKERGGGRDAARGLRRPPWLGGEAGSRANPARPSVAAQAERAIQKQRPKTVH